MPFDEIDETNIPKSVTAETVLNVEHWTDRLFSFSITRPSTFRFRSGEFIMIGLMVDGKPLLRAYSVASPSWDEKLDFYSIKVEDGPLTSRLQHIKEGDKILLGKKPVGTLVFDALTPGKRLYMLSTGTGIAPFASLIRDPDAYEKFEKVILVHTCRQVDELTYGKQLVEAVKEDPLIGEYAKEKLVHYTSVTREDYPVQGRIPALVESGKIFEDLGVPSFNPEDDRIMICGSMDMLKSCKQMALDYGFHEGSNAAPSQFVIEKAFAD